MADDGLGNIGLPDAHCTDAIARNARHIDEIIADRKRSDRRRQIAAVTAPVDEGLVDGDLAEQIIDVVIGFVALGQNDGFAGAGSRSAHAIDLLAIGVRAANHAQQKIVARGAWLLAALG